MEQKFCQSCGMPLKDELLGTNADATLNDDYCIYCYKNGRFTADCTMEEMIDFCTKYVSEMNKHTGLNLTSEEAREQMLKFFPQLKRWKNDNGKHKSIDEKAVELLSRCDTVTLASVNSDGYPRPVVLAKVATKGYNDVWMATATESLKVHDFMNNPKGGLCFREEGNSVSLIGDVEVVVDDIVRQEMWQEWFINHFPKGPTDPTYTLLHFVGKHATLWIDYQFEHKDI